MRRRRRWVWWTLGTIVVLAAAGATLMWSSPRHNFRNSIAALRNLRPKSTTEALFDYSSTLSKYSGPTGLPPIVMSNERFEILRPFDEVDAEIRKELKSRASNASSYPAKNREVTTYMFDSVGTVDHKLVSVIRTWDGTTEVFVVETRPANLVDRARAWFHKAFSSSKTTNPLPYSQEISSSN